MKQPTANDFSQFHFLHYEYNDCEWRSNFVWGYYEAHFEPICSIRPSPKRWLPRSPAVSSRPTSACP